MKESCDYDDYISCFLYLLTQYSFLNVIISIIDALYCR